MKRICMLGLGYVGLPAASIFATNGFEVLGVDTEPSVLDSLAQGFVHIEEPGLQTVVRAAVSSGNLKLASRPAPADVFIIAVGTPLGPDNRMDDGAVRAAAESLLPVLSRDNLVILESTVAPRTTEDVLVPILERSGLKVGDGLHVAYCPERVLPGRTLRELVENDRIIGGVDSRSAELAMQLYSQVVDGPIVATDATSAELSKLMENASRDVNIALANELARVCTHFGRDARSVFALSNRHPRVKLLDAGPGVGGHCIPVDPWFLIQALPQDCRLLRTAREINDQQPARVMQRVKEIVGWPPGPKVTILGLAYKADVDDVRNSPAVQLARMLAGEGYELGICDPHVRSIDLRLTPPTPALEGTDCVLVLTGHSEFLLLDPLQVRQVVRTANLLDTRGALDSKQWAAAGFAVHTL